MITYKVNNKDTNATSTDPINLKIISLPSKHLPFKVNNKITKKGCETYSKLTKKTTEGRPCCRGVFIINFEHL